MRKQKHYVVWEGREKGIFDNWDDCYSSIHAYRHARYKAFSTKEEAFNAFSPKKNLSHLASNSKKFKPNNAPILASISVDAACSGNPGLMEYRAVDNNCKTELFRKGPFSNATNNIGEFLALVHILALTKKTNDSRPIYSDSLTAMKWVKTKHVRTSLKRTNANQSVFQLLDRAIDWLKTNHYNNTILKWNTASWGEIPADFGRK